ncbi:MAG: hypothetical protein Q9163_004074 [Psora crenata]
MPEKSSLAKAYTKGMAWHDCGRPLFHPVPIEAMRAPCVGYFDHHGKWHLITNLTGQPEDPKWKRSEYTYLKEKPNRQPVATHRWGPKRSSNVYAAALGFSAATPDLSAVGIPAQFAIGTQWRTESNLGAFLVTAPPVVHENFEDGYNRPYKMWIKENFETLHYNGKEELQEFGLSVITETYSTAACLIQTWTGRSREVLLDIKAEAMMAGELGPSFQWSKDRNADALSIYTNENYGSRVVVFCSGLRYTLKKWKGVKYEVCWHANYVNPASLRANDYIKPHLVSSKRRGYSDESSSDIIRAANGAKDDLHYYLCIFNARELDDFRSVSDCALVRNCHKKSNNPVCNGENSGAAADVDKRANRFIQPQLAFSKTLF